MTAPSFGGSEQGDDELRAGREDQGDPVTRLDSQSGEGGCHGIGPGFHLAEGDGPILLEQKGPTRILGGSVGQACGDGHALDALDERHGASVPEF